eukprot:CAMPEP_0196247448 /NCGR_PEP_ID=MMETSP0913-20130531/38119_1 /TAXON_ID=49265 /ORGANISM="Thalassiosira rotula, Strain GSO102" /LENGTH=47 /DNA_ID= /DNA_START= /DNA_END= /DNA_ORIENTATION=
MEGLLAWMICCSGRIGPWVAWNCFACSNNSSIDGTPDDDEEEASLSS